MVIVGGGRVGSVFARSGVRVVHRDERVPADPPILLCTQASHLGPTLERYVPPEVRRDCVFLQNGAWEPLLDTWGIPDATRGALWFAAPGGGVFTTNRPSLFWGEHAAAVVGLLHGIGVPAEVLPDRATWRLAWAEKMLWSAIFGLLGERDGGTAGDAARKFDEVRALVEELAPAFDLPLDVAAIPERLCAYSRWMHHAD